MNGFADHGLDEAAFGEKKGFSEGLRTFDAFRTFFDSVVLSLSMIAPAVKLNVAH